MLRLRFQGRQIGHLVERCLHGLDEAEVVDKAALLAHEEVAILGDIEVEYRLDLVGLHGLEPGRAAHGPDDIPGLRSRAMIQPLPAFQNRWIPVATRVSPPSLSLKVGAGAL